MTARKWLFFTISIVENGKMQKYIVHNYKKNIHTGDEENIKSKRRVVSGEGKTLEMCGLVEENGISMKNVL